MSITVSTTTDSDSTKDFTAVASQLADASSTPSIDADREHGDRQPCTVHQTGAPRPATTTITLEPGTPSWAMTAGNCWTRV
ncbi:hypothetical protein [Streptomyces sp. NPDC059479]|uniref:hypothetical protein n=1 Tax=Streptomyces sp. NPDC059479 TaxID=3346848 RepID=UPI00367B630A